MEVDLVSAGALRALCEDLVGPYGLAASFEDEEVAGIHRFHRPCSTGTRWGPVLWPCQGSARWRGSSCSGASSGSAAADSLSSASGGHAQSTRWIRGCRLILL